MSMVVLPFFDRRLHYKSVRGWMTVECGNVFPRHIEQYFGGTVLQMTSLLIESVMVMVMVTTGRRAIHCLLGPGLI